MLGVRHLFFAVDTAQSRQILPSISIMQKYNIRLSCIYRTQKGLAWPAGYPAASWSQEALDQELTPLSAGGTGSQSDSLLMPDYLPDRV